MHSISSAVLILGANADVAKAAIPLYIQKGYSVVAASRSTEELKAFAKTQQFTAQQMTVLYFDAAAFETHQAFYDNLPAKPAIVVYAAGFLKNNEEALRDWEGSLNMMKVHYCGACPRSILLRWIQLHQRIIGLSSLFACKG